MSRINYRSIWKRREEGWWVGGWGRGFRQKKPLNFKLIDSYCVYWKPNGVHINEIYIIDRYRSHTITSEVFRGKFTQNVKMKCCRTMHIPSFCGFPTWIKVNNSNSLMVSSMSGINLWDANGRCPFEIGSLSDTSL